MLKPAIRFGSNAECCHINMGFSKQKDILHRILRTIHAIWYKHRMLKINKADDERIINAMFKLIKTPLKRLVNITKYSTNEEVNHVLPESKVKIKQTQSEVTNEIKQSLPEGIKQEYAHENASFMMTLG